VETPKYNAMWEKQEEEAIRWRKLGGLDPVAKESITFNYRKEPGLEWKN